MLMKLLFSHTGGFWLADSKSHGMAQAASKQWPAPQNWLIHSTFGPPVAFIFIWYYLRVSHKTEIFLMFLVSQLSWLVFVSWFQRHKLLYQAITSDIPSFCLKKCEKYKGFSKFIKGNNFGRTFLFFLFSNNLLGKIGWTGVIAEDQTVV